MNDKKNIDQLFQDKLKNFDNIPNDVVWENIALALKDKKKKKRVFPLWWWAAAGVAILFSGLYFAVNDFENSVEIKNDVVSSDDKNSGNEPVEVIKSKNVSIKPNTEKTAAASVEIQKTSKSKTNSIPTSKNKFIQLPKLNQNVVATTNSNKSEKQPKTLETVSDIHNKSDENFTVESGILEPKDGVSAQDIVEKFTKIDEKKTIKDVKASILSENEKDDKSKINTIKQVEKRWSITTTMAMLNLQSTTNKSNVNVALNDNEKVYQNTISYGVGVQYVLNKKFAIRSGISTVANIQKTNNVAFVQSSQTGNTFLLGNDLEIGGFSLPANGSPIFAGIANTDLLGAIVQSGTIQESKNYIEIPTEIAYKIIDKKIGVQLISGFSTLFLNRNKTALQTINQNIALRSSENVRKVNFTTNFGIGVNRAITKKVSVNIDGMLKYQLNTFNNQSNNPYMFGVYTGLSYKF